jgi:undecaprenyl pyrophosphate phosphatase UppP
VVVGAFQIAFRAEIHVNDVFSFFKNYFWHQHIKTIQKVQTALNFSKKKKFKIWWNAVTKAMPNGALSFFIFKYIKKIFLILLY